MRRCRCGALRCADTVSDTPEKRLNGQSEVFYYTANENKGGEYAEK